MECIKTVFEGDAEYKEIEGYSIWQLSKGTVKKAKFADKIDVGCGVDEVRQAAMEALVNKGQVFGFKDKSTKKIAAIFVVRKKDDSYSCDDIFANPAIAEDKLDLMKYDVCYYMAEAAHGLGMTAFMNGEKIPGIVSEKSTKGFLIGLAVCICFIIGFSSTGDGIGSSIPLGICIGLPWIFIFSSTDKWDEGKNGEGEESVVDAEAGVNAVESAEESKNVVESETVIEEPDNMDSDAEETTVE